jgi:RNA polymerase sigma-70 factor (ECF subfamily)
MTHNEQLSAVKLAVEQLSESDREIVYLRHTAGLTFAQIAETLEQPIGTVLARGHRALAKLRKLLEGEEIEN